MISCSVSVQSKSSSLSSTSFSSPSSSPLSSSLVVQILANSPVHHDYDDANDEDGNDIFIISTIIPWCTGEFANVWNEPVAHS